MTTNTWERRELFRQPKTAEALERKILEYRDRGFYRLHSYVVMPNHLHVILTPRKTTTLEKAVQLIKGGCSHEIHARFPVWQSGFAEHQVRDLDDYSGHVQYIQLNPVKAGLVQRPEEYPFCSAGGRQRMDPWHVASGAEAPEVGRA